MPLASTFISEMFPIEAHEVILMNNVFSTMLLSVVVMYGIESIKSRQEKKSLNIPIFYPAHIYAPVYSGICTAL